MTKCNLKFIEARHSNTVNGFFSHLYVTLPGSGLRLCLEIELSPSLSVTAECLRFFAVD